MTQSTEDRAAKIKKLLAKAEGTTNEAERDTYNAKATELMIQWGIEEAMLSGDDRPADQIVQREFRTDVPKSYSFEYAKIGIQVANALGAKGLFQRKADGRTVTLVVGFESDLARIELLTQSLALQATTALASFWDRHGHRYYSGAEKFNAKRSFITGFADGVKPKLRAVYDRTVASAGHGAELVLVDRTRQVAAYIDANMTTGTARARRYQQDAHGSGHAAGQRADVGQTRVGSSSGRELGQ